LASGIPKSELDMLSVNLDVRDIVLEDGGDIDLNPSTGQKSSPILPISRPRMFQVRGEAKLLRLCNIHCMIDGEVDRD